MKNKFEWDFKPCEVEFLTVYILPVSDPATHWQNAFVNSERQTIKVSIRGEKPFMIDNEDGSGYVKLTNGGHWRLGHKGIEGAVIVRKCEENEIKTEFDKDLYALQEKEIDSMIMRIDPETHKKIKALRRMINR